MNPQTIRTAADAKTLVEERGLKHVKVGVFDMDGILRGKYMSRDKFFSALDKGFGFCDVVLGWDCKDQLYDNVTYTSESTGYPDAPVRILPASCRELPLEDNMLFFLGEFAEKAETICPRGILRRVIQKAQDMGFSALAGMEFEFFMFDETPNSIREKGYRNLQPIAPDWFGYSVIRNTVHSDFYRELLELCEQMDFPLEGLHEETGPGVLEAAITVDDALAAADKAALFKTFSKVLAQKHGKVATFMAKWSPDWPGQSGHTHLSLTGKDGAPVFYDEKHPHGMSRTMQQFVAGQQELMPELLAMAAPTVNSFSRLVPGAWAPTQSAWSVENRTCALRVIPGSAKSQRVEYRVPGADVNPYLGMAAALASGLYGIEQALTLSEPLIGSGYDTQLADEYQLPSNLWQAAQRLKQSRMARDWFGDAFVDHYAATREWEQREFRKAITDWELERYFEII